MTKKYDLEKVRYMMLTVDALSLEQAMEYFGNSVSCSTNWISVCMRRNPRQRTR